MEMEMLHQNKAAQQTNWTTTTSNNNINNNNNNNNSLNSNNNNNNNTSLTAVEGVWEYVSYLVKNLHKVRIPFTGLCVYHFMSYVCRVIKGMSLIYNCDILMIKKLMAMIKLK